MWAYGAELCAFWACGSYDFSLLFIIIHCSCHDTPSTLQVFDLGYQRIVTWCDRPWRPMAPPDVRTNMACTGRLHQLQRVLVGHRVDVDVAGGVTRQPRLPLTLWGIKKKCTFHRCDLSEDINNHKRTTNNTLAKTTHSSQNHSKTTQTTTGSNTTVTDNNKKHFKRNKKQPTTTSVAATTT